MEGGRKRLRQREIPVWKHSSVAPSSFPPLLRLADDRPPRKPLQSRAESKQLLINIVIYITVLYTVSCLPSISLLSHVTAATAAEEICRKMGGTNTSISRGKRVWGDAGTLMEEVVNKGQLYFTKVFETTWSESQIEGERTCNRKRDLAQSCWIIYHVAATENFKARDPLLLFPSARNSWILP